MIGACKKLSCGQGQRTMMLLRARVMARSPPASVLVSRNYVRPRGNAEDGQHTVLHERHSISVSQASPVLGRNGLARLIAGNGSSIVSTTTTARSTRRVYSSSSSRASLSSESPVSVGEAFAIREDGTEKRLVAARELRAGEVLFDGTTGEVSRERSRHSIEVGEGQHLLAADDLLFMDHSCAPNSQLEVVNPASSGQAPYLRVTVRASTVEKGEALTLDYNAMEVAMSCPFDCACGAPNCRRLVSGFSRLPREVQLEYIDGRWSDPSDRAGGVAIPPPPPLTEVVKRWAAANVKRI